jgi:hypothetical protein
VGAGCGRGAWCDVYGCTCNVIIRIRGLDSRAELDNLGGFLGGEKEAGGASRFDRDGLVWAMAGEWRAGEWTAGEWTAGEWTAGEWTAGEWTAGEWTAGEWT